MNQTVDGIEKTVAQTYRWLNEIMEHMPTKDRREAYHALRAVLIALRDRLPVEEVSDLAAQMPMLVRGIFFEGWDPHAATKVRTREEFHARVAEQLPPESGINVFAASRAVIHTLRVNISPEELEQVRGVLPTGLKDLMGPPLA
jgi:uncharacterized protein (DUF2267 family)